jgi:hypothetical protein
MKLQLARMHKHFGSDIAHKCGDCCNFVRGRYHDRILQKCERYGLSHSEATDWAQRWEACGMFDKPLGDNERPVIEYIRGRCAADSPPVLDGQIGFEDDCVKTSLKRQME